MIYLTTLMKLMKTSSNRSCQLLIISHLVKNKSILGTSQDWFDAEIMEKINKRSKVFKKIKKSHLHVDKDDYKGARKGVKKQSLQRKKPCFVRELTEQT